MLHPLGAGCHAVAITGPLNDAEHRQVAALQGRHPKVALQIIGHLNYCVPHLHFLRHYGGLKSLMIDVRNIESTDGMEAVAESVERLSLGPTHPPPLRQGMLATFQKLRSLLLNASPELVSEAVFLPELRSLSVHSIPALDMQLLVRARELQSLHVGLGSIKKLDAMSDFNGLRRLSLWRVKGVEDASFLGNLHDIQDAQLQDFPKIQRLPSLGRLEKLDRLHIESLKSLSDIRGAVEAPNLKELLVFACPKLTPESFQSFVNHPSLTHAFVAIGSTKKNSTIEQMLSLPKPDRFGKGIFDEASD
jgi:hypothetical protein